MNIIKTAAAVVVVVAMAPFVALDVAVRVGRHRRAYARRLIEEAELGTESAGVRRALDRAADRGEQ